jgi:uncharacterized protein YqjF (DUF2071 family)
VEDVDITDPAYVASEPFDTEATKDKPHLEGTETSTKSQVPVAIINDGSCGVFFFNAGLNKAMTGTNQRRHVPSSKTEG